MAADADLVVRARRAVVDGAERAVAVVVRGGVVVDVAAHDAAVVADHDVELPDDEVLLPGLVDTHVHVNEPGRTAWEGFASATRAAAAGGVTTIVDMPLNSVPPTTTVAALDAKRAAARPQAVVDVAFWGGAIPGNLADLAPLHEAGVLGFKCFLLESGVEEFPPLDADGLDLAMHELARIDALMVVHAEDGPEIAAAPAPRGSSYAHFLASRPAEAERRAIAQVVDVARRSGGRAHVVHLSCADALPLLRSARDAAVRITAETCPHYLTFAAEDVPDGATEFKCCPPVRANDHRSGLWRGLADGSLQMVVSDHSPCTPDLKCGDTGDFGEAWGGIASLELGLSAVWTGARERGHALADVVRWMAEAPADLVGLATKGRIAPGAAADLVAFAPDEARLVDPDRLHHRHPVTPYAGRTLSGTVRRTWLRGAVVDPDDDAAPPRGRLLRRGEA